MLRSVKVKSSILFTCVKKLLYYVCGQISTTLINLINIFLTRQLLHLHLKNIFDFNITEELCYFSLGLYFIFCNSYFIFCIIITFFNYNWLLKICIFLNCVLFCLSIIRFFNKYVDNLLYS